MREITSFARNSARRNIPIFASIQHLYHREYAEAIQAQPNQKTMSATWFVVYQISLVEDEPGLNVTVHLVDRSGSFVRRRIIKKYGSRGCVGSSR